MAVARKAGASTSSANPMASGRGLQDQYGFVQYPDAARLSHVAILASQILR